MKIALHIDGPNTTAWFADALKGYHAAQEADRTFFNERWKRENPNDALATAGSSTGAPTPTEEPVAEAPKAEKPKRATRRTVEAAQITTNPEDRKPVEEIEEAEVVETADADALFDDAPGAETKVFTRQDVKDAMQAYVAKHGLDTLAANATTLLGAPKLSAIPEDAAAFEAAVSV